MKKTCLSICVAGLSLNLFNASCTNQLNEKVPFFMPELSATKLVAEQKFTVPIPDKATHPMTLISLPPLTLPGGFLLTSCIDFYPTSLRCCVFVDASSRCLKLCRTAETPTNSWELSETECPDFFGLSPAPEKAPKQVPDQAPKVPNYEETL